MTDYRQAFLTEEERGAIERAAQAGKLWRDFQRVDWIHQAAQDIPMLADALAEARAELARRVSVEEVH